MVILTSLVFSETKILNHYLYMDISPQDKQLHARDKIEAETTDRFWEFSLSAKAGITRLQIGGKDRPWEEINPNADGSDRELKRIRVQRKFMESAVKIIDISYSAVLYQDVNQAEFSREKIAMEVNGTISEEGVFLSPSGGFYPMADETVMMFHTVVKLPAGWDAVSEGELISAEKNDDYSEITYRTRHPLDGIHITAAQWVVDSVEIDGVRFFTYFFEEDISLAEDYMNMSVEYVQMYSEMLSPYPFTKFAVVENFFPTGYGMPSYTVLGRSIVKLPFIVNTSLGHEVLHNWWGNSVFVGDEGNWCEGLTTYQADYLYKLRQGPSSARQYRKDILKDFTVFVNGDSDIPPSEFSSRYDMASRAVGYGKVAMIFHMLEEHFGHEPFISALKQVIKEKQFTQADWSDFFSAIEAETGQDLSEFKQKWVDENDAPRLNLKVEGDKMTLIQSGSVKPMWIPVSYVYDDGTKIIKEVYSNSEQVTLSPPELTGLLEVRVDEDYHIMRRLHDSEMDPTIREILSGSEFIFLVPETTPEWKEIARKFNGFINGDETADIRTTYDGGENATVIYLGTNPESLSNLRMNGHIRINSEVLDAEEHCLVWAFKEDDGTPGMVVYSADPRELIPVARKIPHYGKYGYLVFNHGQNIMKGNHESPDSPLIWKK